MTSELTPAMPKKPTPMALRPKPVRLAHVAQRLQERCGIVWSVEQVRLLESKIKIVRRMVNEGKTPTRILPAKIGSEKEDLIHFYRVWCGGKPVTFVWSQVCRGLITVRGPGELIEPSPPYPPLLAYLAEVEALKEKAS